MAKYPTCEVCGLDTLVASWEYTQCSNYYGWTDLECPTCCSQFRASAITGVEWTWSPAGWSERLPSIDPDGG